MIIDADYTELEEHVHREVNGLGNGARVLAAVSGGADSVALLVALQRTGCNVVAAHCNFQLRGEESNRDQHFVEDLCRRLGVELKVTHFDVAAYRAEHGCSMEMACRELRYDWFRLLMSHLGCMRLLTAHHADDNVETMLLNMIRGCGLEGAKGMVADTGEIMRPLLPFRRSDIEAYLREVGETWIVDSTNLETEPDRNFIRLEVLPLLERRFPGATGRLARTQRYLGEAFKIYGKWRSHLETDRLSREGVLASPAPGATIHEWVRNYGFSAAQESEMLEALNGDMDRTRMWEAPGADYVVLLEKEGFRCVSAIMPRMVIRQERIKLNVKWQRRIATNKNRYVAYFPRPMSEYRLRTALPGDRMMIGARKTKKVSDVLKEGGVPLPWRKEWPVLAREDQVVWVPGIRRSVTSLLTSDSEYCYVFTASIEPNTAE